MPHPAGAQAETLWSPMAAANMRCLPRPRSPRSFQDARSGRVGHPEGTGGIMNRARLYLSRPPHCEPELGADDRTAPICTTPATHSVRRSAHSGRSGSNRQPANPETAADSDRTVAAARRFADFALRATLEVVDRRRSAATLRGTLEPSLIDMVRVLAQTSVRGRALGAAALGPVHVRMVDEANAEIFGTYSRGPRVFAVAGRVTSSGNPAAWRVTSLRL